LAARGLVQRLSSSACTAFRSTLSGTPSNSRCTETSFFLSRETIIPTEMPGMALWCEKLFVWMTQNAESAMRFFKLPVNRVLELGTQIEI
jgi:KUP system potassium uptake protein